MVIGAVGSRSRSGWLVAELMFALALLAIAMIPLAFSFRGEQKLVRTHYHQVVAMEIVDGEMEFLRAGQWRTFAEGEHAYTVTARSATNLPAGKFVLMRAPTTLRLEWLPARRGSGGKASDQSPRNVEAPSINALPAVG
jgi:hypothetical protein